MAVWNCRQRSYGRYEKFRDVRRICGSNSELEISIWLLHSISFVVCEGLHQKFSSGTRIRKNVLIPRQFNLRRVGFCSNRLRMCKICSNVTMAGTRVRMLVSIRWNSRRWRGEGRKKMWIYFSTRREPLIWFLASHAACDWLDLALCTSWRCRCERAGKCPSLLQRVLRSTS